MCRWGFTVADVLKRGDVTAKWNPCTSRKVYLSPQNRFTRCIGRPHKAEGVSEHPKPSKKVYRMVPKPLQRQQKSLEEGVSEVLQAQHTLQAMVSEPQTLNKRYRSSQQPL